MVMNTSPGSELPLAVASTQASTEAHVALSAGAKEQNFPDATSDPPKHKTSARMGSAQSNIVALKRSAAASSIPDAAQHPTVASDGVAEEAQAESVLVGKISQLWSAQRTSNSSLRHSRKELDEIRLDLGKQLHAYKQLLVRTGRSGKWTPFLRGENIPRATADRYVQKWEKSLSPEPKKRLNEAISPPSPDEIAAIVRKLLPKLSSILPTQDSVRLFLRQLEAALQRQEAA